MLTATSPANEPPNVTEWIQLGMSLHHQSISRQFTDELQLEHEAKFAEYQNNILAESNRRGSDIHKYLRGVRRKPGKVSASYLSSDQEPHQWLQGVYAEPRLW